MILRRFIGYFVATMVLLPSSPIAPCQTTPDKSTGVNPADPAGILHQLAPGDAPPPSFTLKPADRTRAIPLLVAAKREQTGWQRQLAVYLLATLGYEYERNRDELLRVWRRDGDDGTMELLIDLYSQGHKEFLAPLLAGYNGWNAAASEGLGSFYSEQLERNPRGFLAALSTFTPRRQLYLCTAAGGTDGGGMGAKTERKVLANLKGIGGDVADRCARGVRAGNKDAEDAGRHLPQQQTKQE